MPFNFFGSSDRVDDKSVTDEVKEKFSDVADNVKDVASDAKEEVGEFFSSDDEENTNNNNPGEDTEVDEVSEEDNNTPEEPEYTDDNSEVEEEGYSENLENPENIEVDSEVEDAPSDEVEYEPESDDVVDTDDSQWDDDGLIGTVEADDKEVGELAETAGTPPLITEAHNSEVTEVEDVIGEEDATDNFDLDNDGETEDTENYSEDNETETESPYTLEDIHIEFGGTVINRTDGYLDVIKHLVGSLPTYSLDFTPEHRGVKDIPLSARQQVLPDDTFDHLEEVRIVDLIEAIGKENDQNPTVLVVSGLDEVIGTMDKEFSDSPVARSVVYDLVKTILTVAYEQSVGLVIVVDEDNEKVESIAQSIKSETAADREVEDTETDGESENEHETEYETEPEGDEDPEAVVEYNSGVETDPDDETVTVYEEVEYEEPQPRVR